MKKKNTVAVVTEIVQPIAAQLNLKIWDVVFEKEGASWFLRVLLDGVESPVTVNDCENAARILSDRLDEIDPIEQSYYLEVSSAGLGRRLKKPEHLKQFLGRQASLRLIRPREGEREFCGILKSVHDSQFVLKNDSIEQKFTLSECSFVKLDDDLNLFD